MQSEIRAGVKCRVKDLLCKEAKAVVNGPARVPGGVVKCWI